MKLICIFYLSAHLSTTGTRMNTFLLLRERNNSIFTFLTKHTRQFSRYFKKTLAFIQHFQIKSLSLWAEKI